jgi:hypothetical protein
MVPLKNLKEKRAGLQFTSTDYLSLILTPFRIQMDNTYKMGTD